jgi:16S rRNA (guanine966-N2)-methyltransferase
MSDKMRGALFNILGDLTDMMILDAFAGSGALSFEAISRGASHAVAIEQDRGAQRTIAENILALGLTGHVKLIKAGAGAWLRTSKDTFDVVVLDPPYDALQPNLLVELSGRVLPGGILALSWPGKQNPPEFAGFTLQNAKQYGDSSLYFFSRDLAVA